MSLNGCCILTASQLWFQIEKLLLDVYRYFLESVCVCLCIPVTLNYFIHLGFSLVYDMNWVFKIVFFFQVIDLNLQFLPMSFVNKANLNLSHPGFAGFEMDLNVFLLSLEFSLLSSPLSILGFTHVDRWAPGVRTIAAAGTAVRACTRHCAAGPCQGGPILSRLMEETEQCFVQSHRRSMWPSFDLNWGVLFRNPRAWLWTR